MNPFLSTVRNPLIFDCLDLEENIRCTPEFLEDTVLHLDINTSDNHQYRNGINSKMRPSPPRCQTRHSNSAESETSEDVMIEEVAVQEIISDLGEERALIKISPYETSSSKSRKTDWRQRSHKKYSYASEIGKFADEFTYECHQCKNTFRRKKSLVNHILSHKFPANCMKNEFSECCDVMDSIKENKTGVEGTSSNKNRTEFPDEEIIEGFNETEFYFDSEGISNERIPPANPCGNFNSSEERVSTDHFLCSYCGKKCKDYRGLKKHNSVHSDGHFLCCYVCGKQFYSRTRLKRHMLSHRDKSINCEICGEKVADYRALAHHRSSHHTGNRNGNLTARSFPCHMCEKVFSSRSSQQIHMRVHTGERPYSCKFCVKAFADGGTLRKHERIHTGEKPYVCPICSKAFNQRVVLREHIRVHHSSACSTDTSHKCQVCPTVCNSSQELCTHLVKHSDDNTAMSRKPSEKPRKYRKWRKSKIVLDEERKHLINRANDVYMPLNEEILSIHQNSCKVFEDLVDNKIEFPDTDVFKTTDILLPFVAETTTKNWEAVNKECNPFAFDSNSYQFLGSFGDKLPPYCNSMELSLCSEF